MSVDEFGWDELDLSVAYSDGPSGAVQDEVVGGSTDISVG
jgi:hypothetical protein